MGFSSIDTDTETDAAAHHELRGCGGSVVGATVIVIVTEPRDGR
jgi:hypothetical protein